MHSFNSKPLTFALLMSLLTITCQSYGMEQNKEIINCPANQKEVVQLKELAVAWQHFYKDNKYRNLMAQSTPIVEGCGIIHELKNASIFRTRRNETACIVDMSQVVGATAPHFHRKETEVYLILQGSGKVVIGKKEYTVKPGDVVHIPKDVGHYTVPTDNLVLGVVNVPFFDPADFFDLVQTDEATRNEVEYNHAQYLHYKNK